MSQIQLVATGMAQRVDGSVDRIPEFDSRSGDHYWIAITTYKVNPEVFIRGDSHLDNESLVAIAGPVCYYCELLYTSLLNKRRCSGHPRS